MTFVGPALQALLLAIVITASLTQIQAVSSGSQESCGLNRTVVRRKRFLTFPPRSELLFRISLLKSTPWRTNVFTIHEIDVQVPLPENLHALIFEKDSPGHHQKPKTRGFRFPIDYFSSFSHLVGLDGKACFERFQCELNQLKPRYIEKSFLLRSLSLLLRPDVTRTNKSLQWDRDCHKAKCALSLIPDSMMRRMP